MTSSLSTHSSDESTHEASAFLKKTYSILQDKNNQHAVNWSQHGTAFTILNPEYFAKEILPKYFKHNNLKSFVRQLNIHGFKKCNSRLSKNREYCHEYFLHGSPELMNRIYRISVKSTKSVGDEEHSVVNRLAELEVENCELKNKIKVLQEDLQPKPSFVVQEQCGQDGDTWAVLQALQVYSKVRRLQGEVALTEIDPTEEDLFRKTRDLLETFQKMSKFNQSNLQSTAVESFLDFDNNESLGKRSSPELSQDSQSFFHLDFSSSSDSCETFSCDADFELGLSN